MRFIMQLDTITLMTEHKISRLIKTTEQQYNLAQLFGF